MNPFSALPLLISRARVKLFKADKVQVQTFGQDLTEANNAQPYGLTAYLPQETQVILLSPSGDRGRALSALSIAPEGMPKPQEGEVILWNQGGALLKLKKDGSIEVTGDATFLSNLTIDGDLKVEGKTEIQGDVSLGGKLSTQGEIQAQGKIESSVDVMGGGISLKTHTHPTTSEGAPTGAPTP